MKQSVKVSLLGQEYHLKSDVSAEEVRRVAEFVENQIAQVTASGRTVDTMQAAILALFNVSAAFLEGNSAGGQTDSEQQVRRLADRIENALESGSTKG